MKRFTLIFLITLFACDRDPTEQDLATICSAFEHLEQEPGLKSMPAAARLSYVQDAVSGRLATPGNVHEIWVSFPNFSSGSKYSIFKSTAESLVEGPWRCDPMERLASSMGP